jgi:hypothetical protein
MSEENANPPVATVTIEETIEEKLKEASDKYIQELRLAISARVTKEDGTLGEPGALPQEQLVKHYKGEPLDAKE